MIATLAFVAFGIEICGALPDITFLLVDRLRCDPDALSLSAGTSY